MMYMGNLYMSVRLYDTMVKVNKQTMINLTEKQHAWLISKKPRGWLTFTIRELIDEEIRKEK